MSEVAPVFYLGKLTGHPQTQRDVWLPLTLTTDDGWLALDPVAGVAGHHQAHLAPVARAHLGVGHLGPGTLTDHALGSTWFPDSALAPIARLAPPVHQLVTLSALHLDGVPLLVVVPGALHHRHPQPRLQLRTATNINIGTSLPPWSPSLLSLALLSRVHGSLLQPPAARKL